MRIIPTRVGTRSLFPSHRKGVQDHPHACGDKLISVSCTIAFLGSSPRVWGQDEDFKRRFFTIRIIPTRVGTRHLLLSGFPTFRDHPHACGDKSPLGSTRANLSGSSPRVWGQALALFNVARVGGIIPTRVGTRRCRFIKTGNVQDHPHACGDK